MKHFVHMLLAGVPGGFVAYREMWAPLPGCAQSVMDLIHLGYRWTDITQARPQVDIFVDLAVLVLAIVAAGYSVLRIWPKGGE